MFHQIYKKLFQINITANKSLIRNCSGTSGEQFPKRIFSGVQPTGTVHIGNYLGAIKRWIDLQNQNEDVIISIADLHSITLPQDPTTLRSGILEMTATLLACGIDPEKSILFLQSSVSRHSELSWILGCITTMARLSHLPQFKEKSESMKEVPLGLFVYPVLQAADILLYKATHVPVGEDQLQHLQMAQQIVKTFNHRFGKTFPSPRALIESNPCSRLKSLRDVSKKMSKSDPDPKSRILLTDDPETVKAKFKKAITDFTPQLSYDPVNRPGVSNLLDIHSMFTNSIPEEIVEENETVTTGMYKFVVAKTVSDNIEPIRLKIQNYLAQPKVLVDILEMGAIKADVIAKKTLEEVQEKVGIGIPNNLTLQNTKQAKM